MRDASLSCKEFLVAKKKGMTSFSNSVLTQVTLYRISKTVSLISLFQKKRLSSRFVLLVSPRMCLLRVTC